MSEFWFRPKRYGYGATPTSWKGWVTVLVFVALLVVTWPAAGAAYSRGGWDAFAYAVFELVLVGGFVLFTRAKTDGGWRWRWGNK